MVWVLIVIAIMILVLCDQSPRAQKRALCVLCIIFTINVGMRTNDWNDTSNYWASFSRYVKPIWDISLVHTDHFIEDKGFLFLNSLIKTVTSDRFLFFASIAGITNYFLYKDLMTYTAFPISGFIIYIGRFALNRNFMQIRAALAILMVMYAIKFISDRNWRKYFLWVALASTIHFSMVFAIPVYWINRLSLNKKRVIYLTILACIITYFLSNYFQNIITAISFRYSIATAYTSEHSEYTQGQGLSNPIIILQTTILWVYTLFEKQLSNRTPYYFTIRNAYFYSTILLILLSSFGVLSGRISTIFATLEIFMLPNLCKVFKPRYYYLIDLVIALFGLGFFYLYFSNFVAQHPSFDNPLIN